MFINTHKGNIINCLSSLWLVLQHNIRIFTKSNVEKGQKHSRNEEIFHDSSFLIHYHNMHLLGKSDDICAVFLFFKLLPLVFTYDAVTLHIFHI